MCWRRTGSSRCPPLMKLSQSGFLQHLLPRFSLKHGVRITQVADSGDVAIGAEGLPVFVGLGTVWHCHAKRRRRVPAFS